MADVIVSGVTYEGVKKVQLKSSIDRTRYEEFIPVGRTIINPYPLSAPEAVIENTVGHLETSGGNHFDITPYGGFHINLADIFGLYGLSWAAAVGTRIVTSKSRVLFTLNTGDTIRTVLRFSNDSKAIIYFGLRNTDGNVIADELPIVNDAQGVTNNQINSNTLKEVDYTFTYSGETVRNIGAIYIASTGVITNKCEFELELYHNDTRLI